MQKSNEHEEKAEEPEQKSEEPGPQLRREETLAPSSEFTPEERAKKAQWSAKQKK